MAFVDHLRGYYVDFGEAVVFGTATATAIVDMPTRAGFDTLATDTTLRCIAADVATVSAGDPVTVRAVSYTVRTVEPDGNGETFLTVTTP